MNDGIGALGKREKEALRLLLGGHDAKSAARELGLSVHTVNEHLREARRKLGVTSSREAARRLGEAERASPDPLVPKELGVVAAVAGGADRGRPDRGGPMGGSFVWLAGGMFVMSLVIAAAALLHVLPASAADERPAAAASASDPAATESARRWVALLDGERWDDSWRATGTLFRTQITMPQWAATIRPVRRPLGAVSSRRPLSATRTASLPGAPAGDYEVVQFRTGFATRADATETVVMAHEGDAWKVSGYFIR